MATYTSTLSLIKPADGDKALISQINANMDSIDTEFQTVQALLNRLIPIGMVAHFAKNAVPGGSKWLACNGAAVSRNTYSELFAVCGTTFGAGDGSTTFNLPNLYGKVVAGYHSGNTGDYQVGVSKGSNTTTLTEGNLPKHTHTMGHTHAIDHNHAAVTSSSTSITSGNTVLMQVTGTDGSKPNAYANWVVTLDNRGGNTRYPVFLDNSGSVGEINGAHTHTVDLPAFSGSSGASSAANTGTTGGGTAFDTRDAYLALFPMIRAL